MRVRWGQDMHYPGRRNGKKLLNIGKLLFYAVFFGKQVASDFGRITNRINLVSCLMYKAHMNVGYISATYKSNYARVARFIHEICPLFNFKCIAFSISSTLWSHDSARIRVTLISAISNESFSKHLAIFLAKSA